MAGAKRQAKQPMGEQPRKGSRKVNNEASQPASRRITRHITTDAPRKATFETTELLENILSFLPPKTLFGVQRVSRRFKDVIEKSIKLQQKMFLRSCGGEKQLWAPVRVKGTEEDLTFAMVSSAATEQSRRDAVMPVQLSFLFDIITNAKNTFPHHQQDLSSTRGGNPPACKATIVCYWSINHRVYGTLKHDAENQAGLTISDLMTALLDEKDPKDFLGLSIRQSYWTDHNINGTFEEVTPASVLEELEAKYRRQARISSLQLTLPDLVVPTEKEWDEMRQASVESV